MLGLEVGNVREADGVRHVADERQPALPGGRGDGVVGRRADLVLDLEAVDPLAGELGHDGRAFLRVRMIFAMGHVGGSPSRMGPQRSMCGPTIWPAFSCAASPATLPSDCPTSRTVVKPWAR